MHMAFTEDKVRSANDGLILIKNDYHDVKIFKGNNHTYNRT